jgi:hypothetical protein
VYQDKVLGKVITFWKVGPALLLVEGKETD